MTDLHTLHVHLRLDDGAYWGTVDEFPGVFATADTIEELRESLEEALWDVLAASSEDPERVRLEPLHVTAMVAEATTELAGGR